ncbi:MAG: GFA family protein [Parvibaculales bacterium]
MMNGSCLCGAVTYTYDRERADQALNCHCRDCQKVTGAGKVTVVGFPQDAVQIDGDYKIFEKLGTDGSHVRRAFCPDCGSQLFTFVREFEGFMFVKAGTMDDASWVQPVANCWTPSGHDWCTPSDGIINFEANPPAE